jgi:hypothetical protein
VAPQPGPFHSKWTGSRGSMFMPLMVTGPLYVSWNAVGIRRRARMNLLLIVP